MEVEKETHSTLIRVSHTPTEDWTKEEQHRRAEHFKHLFLKAHAEVELPPHYDEMDYLLFAVEFMHANKDTINEYMGKAIEGGN